MLLLGYTNQTTKAFMNYLSKELDTAIIDLHSAANSQCWDKAKSAISTIRKSKPLALERIMYDAIKDGKYNLYYALSRNDVAPTICDIEWAADCDKYQRVDIMKDVIEHYPDLSFERRGCLTLSSAAKNAPLDLWIKIYLLCLSRSDDSNQLKECEHKLENAIANSLRIAVKAENTKIVSYILDTVLEDFSVSKNSILTSPSLSIAIKKSKPIYSIPILVRHGFNMNNIPFDALLKKSHKNDRYQFLIDELGSDASTDIMLMAAKHKKSAFLIACFEQYILVPDISRLQECKTIMNYYLNLKKTTPLSFLTTCKDNALLSAATLATLQ